MCLCYLCQVINRVITPHKKVTFCARVRSGVLFFYFVFVLSFVTYSAVCIFEIKDGTRILIGFD